MHHLSRPQMANASTTAYYLPVEKAWTKAWFCILVNIQVLNNYFNLGIKKRKNEGIFL